MEVNADDVLFQQNKESLLAKLKYSYSIQLDKFRFRFGNGNAKTSDFKGEISDVELSQLIQSEKLPYLNTLSFLFANKYLARKADLTLDDGIGISILGAPICSKTGEAYEPFDAPTGKLSFAILPGILDFMVLNTATNAGPSGAMQTPTVPDAGGKQDTVGCLPGDGLHPDERCLIWGGKKYERLTPKMISILDVMIEQFKKGFSNVSLDLIRQKKKINFDGSFIQEAFKQNRRGEPKLHPVSKVIEKVADGEYRLIDPIVKIPE